jgi:uncharacterized protein GlcG (DUF336 family)
MPEGTVNVSSEVAWNAVEAVVAKAVEAGARSNIAVVDAAANLITFLRMDGAMPGSGDLAIKKARTAALFQMTTEALSGLSQPGQPLHGIEASSGDLVLFGGGAPIRDAGGVVWGAVGVSGSTIEMDTMLAAAGAAAVSGADAGASKAA